MSSNDSRMLSRMFRKPEPRLLDRLRDAIRTRHYSHRTEKQYVAWVRRYINFHDAAIRAISGSGGRSFLSHLATHCRVSAATQSQALAALLFLYKHVLGIACRGCRKSFGHDVPKSCPWCCPDPRCARSCPNSTIHIGR